MKKNIKYGANTLITVLLTIGVVIFAMLISYNNHKRFDLTESRSFTLSPQTEKILKNLNADVEVLVFYTKGGNFFQNANGLLDQYKYYTKRLKVVPMNSDQNPGDLKKYNLSNPNSMVLISGKRREIITLIDEQSLTNAIIKVLQEGNKTILFTSGHGERDINGAGNDAYALAAAALKSEGCEVNTVNLLRDKISAQCNVLVIAGPKTNFLPEEVEMIENYMESGGSVMFLFEPMKQSLSLFKFLDEIGLQVNGDVIADPLSQKYLNRRFWPMAVLQGLQHPIIREMGNMMTFYPLARSLTIKANPPEGIKWETFVQTVPQAWGETDIAKPDSTFDPKVDIKGPLTIGAAAVIPLGSGGSKEKEAENKKKEARLVVFGNVEFASNAFFQQQGNGNMFLNSVSWLAEQEGLISIRPKDAKFSPLFLNETDKTWIWFLLVIIIPTMIFALGFTVFILKWTDSKINR